MLHDVVYAFRTLRRRPLLATIAAITLGVGVGGATAVFSVVDAVVLRPLPFGEPDQLVKIHEITPEGVPFSVSEPSFLDLSGAPTRLVRVAAFRDPARMVLSDRSEPSRVSALAASASFAEVLQVPPALGRFFDREADRPDASRQVVLGDRLWRDRFSADPSILGSAVRLNDEVYTVVGVMPRGFDFPAATDLWLPLGADAQGERDNKDLTVIGRLQPGASIESLRTDLRAFGARVSDANPEANRGWTFGALAFDEWLVSPRLRYAVWVLFAAVGLLLLLACANVANLLLASGMARSGEIRIRAALGASRSRITRQLLMESVGVGLLGTIVGIFVAMWSISAVQMLGADRVPRLDEARVNGLVLGFAAVAGLVSCFLAGLAPAFHGSRVDLRTGLDTGSRHTAGPHTLRHALVVVEVALALVLVVGAGLLGGSFVRLVSSDPGFDAGRLIAMPVEAPASRYADDRLVRFVEDVLERSRAIPGVEHAAATSTSPFRQFGFSNNVTPEDRAASAPASGLVQAGWRSVTPGFFETVGVPVLAGRVFDTRDQDGRERVVVVSESLARLLWPDGDAVGKRVFWGGTTGRPRTVVGVVADFQDVSLGTSSGPVLFVPHAQVPLPGMTVLVRTPLEQAALAPALRELMRTLDPSLPAPGVLAVSDSRSAAAAGPRFNTALLAAFAVIAFVLAITGVYGMLSFTAIERRRELAVRMALGASGSDIVRLLVSRGVALTAIGGVIGVALAVALTRVLRSLLFEVTPTDPWTFLAATLALIAAATVACYLPARRAARVDPVRVLNG
jgi:predicted permease